uniref:Cell division cycle protein 27 homolog n=1 Tax=Neogobius melanostomus TaxID=47308 RepID=A0A8C6WX01_9GOBI
MRRCWSPVQKLLDLGKANDRSRRWSQTDQGVAQCEVSLGAPFLKDTSKTVCLCCSRGQPDPDQVFRLPQVAPPSQPVSPAQTQIPSHRLDTALMETPQDTLELNRLNLEASSGKLNSDLSVSYIDSSLISPETVSVATAASLLSNKQNKPKSGRSLLGGPPALSPLTPSFGILPLEPSPGDPSYHLQNFSSGLDAPPGPNKKTVSRISQSKVFSQSGNSREVLPIPFNQSQQSAAPHTSGTPQVLSPSGPPNIQPRRSTRLFTSASSTAKENSKKLKMKFPTKIPTEKPNVKQSPRPTPTSTRAWTFSASTTPAWAPTSCTPRPALLQVNSIMNTLRDLGRGYLLLCSYSCKEAIAVLSSLAHFELADYTQAERIFSEVRRIESYREEGMEIYSTTLWHLQKDVALSALSKEMTDMDRNCPQWYILKNGIFVNDTSSKTRVSDCVVIRSVYPIHFKKALSNSTLKLLCCCATSEWVRVPLIRPASVLLYPDRALVLNLNPASSPDLLALVPDSESCPKFLTCIRLSPD